MSAGVNGVVGTGGSGTAGAGGDMVVVDKTKNEVDERMEFGLEDFGPGFDEEVFVGEVLADLFGVGYEDEWNPDHFTPGPFRTRLTAALEGVRVLFEDTSGALDLAVMRAADAEREHVQRLTELNHDVSALNESVAAVDVGRAAGRAGNDLGVLDVQKRRAEEARDLLNAYMVFASGDLTRIRSELLPENDPAKAVSILNRLERIVPDLDGLPEARETLDLIDKESVRLENSLLDKFVSIASFANVQKMANLAKILTDFNGGDTCIAAYVRSRPVISGPSDLASSTGMAALTNLAHRQVSGIGRSGTGRGESASAPKPEKVDMDELVSEILEAVRDEEEVMSKVFPDPARAMRAFLRAVIEKRFAVDVDRVLENEAEAGVGHFLRALDMTYRKALELGDHLSSYRAKDLRVKELIQKQFQPYKETFVKKEVEWLTQVTSYSLSRLEVGVYAPIVEGQAPTPTLSAASRSGGGDPGAGAGTPDTPGSGSGSRWKKLRAAVGNRRLGDVDRGRSGSGGSEEGGTWLARAMMETGEGGSDLEDKFTKVLQDAIRQAAKSIERVVALSPNDAVGVNTHQVFRVLLRWSGRRLLPLLLDTALGSLPDPGVTALGMEKAPSLSTLPGTEGWLPVWPREVFTGSNAPQALENVVVEAMSNDGMMAAANSGQTGMSAETRDRLVLPGVRGWLSVLGTVTQHVMMVDNHWSTVVAPAIGGDMNSYSLTAADKNDTWGALETRVMSGLELVVRGVLNVAAVVLTTDTRKTEYRPKDDAIVEKPSLGVNKVAAWIRAHGKVVASQLDGANRERVLRVLGRGLTQLFLEHLKRMSAVSSIGALQLIQDVGALQGAVRTFGMPDVENQMNVLREVPQLFLVDPSNLRSVVEESTMLSQMDRGLVLGLIALRTDFKQAKLDKLFVEQ